MKEDILQRFAQLESQRKTILKNKFNITCSGKTIVIFGDFFDELELLERIAPEKYEQMWIDFLIREGV